MSTLNKRNPIAKAIKLALLATATVSAVNVPGAYAEEEASEEENQKIVITGSRIPRKEISQPSPIVSLDSEQLKTFGTADLGSILSELSSVSASDTLAGNSGSNQEAGVSSANLRSLGAKRTLTLVNGKRHVAGSPGSAQVDLSTIPASLVERIEIITGGASAIYGSDAVTGVINIILKEDYDGFEVNISGAKSMEDVGNANSNMNLLAGTDFSEGRGNITVYAGREYTQEVMSNDLQHFNNWGTIANPNDTGENDGIPDRLFVQNVGSEMINRFGVINPFGPDSARYTFTADGTPILQATRDGTNSFAFGNFAGGCDTCFFTEDYENILPQVEKVNVGSTLNYSFNDHVDFYGEFKYVQSEIEQQFQPSFRFGNISINVVDNPFLDSGLRETLLDEGTTSVSMAKFFDELGNRSANNRRQTFRVVAGLKGEFDIAHTPVSYDLFYVNGRTENSRKTLNDLIPDNFTAALDAVIDPLTGEVACRSQVPSAQGDGYVDPAALNGDQCVAYNPFGYNAASAAAKDFVSADVLRQDSIGQEYYGFSFNFDTEEFANLPGGPIGFALGFEKREEYSESITDELTKSGILAGAATPDTYGEYDVTESFIEIQIPLLADLPMAHELTIDAAYRTAEYSHSGDADAWKVGFMYAPIEDLRIRGTVGESVRAPNITEAFDPQSPGFERVSDPCDADNIGDDPDRATNCAALGIPADFQANDNVSVDIISGGNPELSEETSESTTIGIVWTPSFLEGFSWSIDTYEIDIADAIIEVTAQTIADNCVDASSGLDANFCSQVDRNPETNDIELIRSGFINASYIKAKGLETELRYISDLDFVGLPGSLQTSLNVTQLDDLTFFEFQNKPEERDVDNGQVGDPELQARLTLNYNLDDLTVSWVSRFVERSAKFDVTPDTDSPEDQSPAYIGSVTTHDLSANYNFSENLSSYVGIRNIGNKLAPGHTADPIYDLFGRRIFAGISVRF